MKEFWKGRKPKIVISIVVLLAVLMFAAASAGSPTPSGFLGWIASPFQAVVTAVGNGATSFFTTFTNASSIQEENEALREEVAALREQLVDYENIKRQNEQYRESLNIREEYPDFVTLDASVIGRYPGERFSSFMLDRGSLDGVSLYDPVMDSSGLLGYVSELGATYCRVQTILDPGLSVGAYDATTRDVGVVSSTVELSLEGLCRISYLDRDCEVQPGDLIVTSGQGGVFPADIVIGRVEEVELEYHGLSLYAVIRPAADPTTVTNAFILTDFYGQGDTLPSLE